MLRAGKKDQKSQPRCCAASGTVRNQIAEVGGKLSVLKKVNTKEVIKSGNAFMQGIIK